MTLHPGMRDRLPEARSWREHMNPESPLVNELVDVSDWVLEYAYHSWWQIYSEGIRSAPSNYGGRGVSERDAKAAGDLATKSVLAYLTNRPERI